MWELYISPHLLSEAEWDALAQSIRWAKNRFPLLKNTEMIGGNPGKREAYGYAHFSDTEGIITLRNPSIQPQTVSIELLPSQGVRPLASSLVLEQVYPIRWISPRLYAAEDAINLSLGGYETAVYEIYPLEEAEVPLLAGVTFETIKPQANSYTIKVLESDKNARLLNPEKLKNPSGITIPEVKTPPLVQDVSLSAKKNEINIHFGLLDKIIQATLAVLLEPEVDSGNVDEIEISVTLGTKKVEPKIEKQNGKWYWMKLPVKPGIHSVKITVKSGEERWRSRVSAWLVCDCSPQAKKIQFNLTRRIEQNRPMPPSAFPAGTIRKNILLGNASL
jgi:hypothetical protein